MTFYIYLIGIIDTFKALSATVCILSASAYVLVAVAMVDPPENTAGWNYETARRRARNATVACLILLVFLPNSKTLTAMVVASAITDNATLKKEGGELYGMAKNLLKQLGEEYAD